MSIIAQSPANLLQTVNKRVLAATAAFIIAAIVGATSFAAAQSTNNADKPTKEWCAAQGFTNYGQCVAAWAHSKGYAGNGSTTNNVNTNVTINSKGDHNAISVVLNYVFGS